MSNFQDTTLFTYDRLSQFVKNYQTEINHLIKKADETDGLYKYYHFDYSPRGIHLTDLKRIPAEILINCSPNWRSYSQLNSVDAWKMNLGQMYVQIKSTEWVYLKSLSKTPGLEYRFVSLPENMNSEEMINAASIGLEAGTKEKIAEGTLSSNLYDPIQKNAEPLSIIKGAVAFEWFGYFFPIKGLGNYTIEITNANNKYLHVWFGSKAICEYISSNSDIPNGTSNKCTVNTTEQTYYPIRIQLFSNTGSIPGSINIIIKKDTANQIPNESCLSVIRNMNGTTYLPKLMYCAFVSPSKVDLMAGKFRCFYYDIAQQQIPSVDFYSTINKYKFDMQMGIFDIMDGVNLDYGEIPDIDKTKYTPVSGNLKNGLPDPESLPSAFSLYRLDVDIRMGNTFQINATVDTNQQYDMRKMDPSLLNWASNYEELPNYYPGDNSVPMSGIVGGESCKTACNDISNCSYYFTYLTADGTEKCVIDSESTMKAPAIPNFNQIPPKDPTDSSKTYTNGALFMRNRQFIEPTCFGQNITANGTFRNPDVISLTSVANTDQYDTSFKYANYNWNQNDLMKQPDDIGICGDPTYGFKKHNDEAKEILFDNALYKNYGAAWTTDPNTIADNKNRVERVNIKITEGMSTPDVKINIKTTAKIGNDGTRVTNAVDDTANNVNAGLYNQEQYAHLMENINTNYQHLSKSEIPQYLNTRAFLEANPDADYNGNTLLYYNSQSIPTAKQQKVIDMNEGIAKQNLLYLMGGVTAATLLVLAIIIGNK